jgi:transposase
LIEIDLILIGEMVKSRMDLALKKARLQADSNLPKSMLGELLNIVAHAEILQVQAAEASAQAAQLQTALAKAQEQAQYIQCHNDKLILELAYLRRMRFGAKTEAWSSNQRDLFEECFSADVASIEAELEKKTNAVAAAALEAAAKPAPVRQQGRQPLPEHLPRVDIVHDIDSCDCTQCGKALVKIGADITEKLTVKPAVFSVERHITPKYACRTCQTVVAQPVAPAIIDGGSVSTDLLAWVITSKFVDHLPLYRIEQIGARNQVPLPRSNLSAWIGRSGVALEPICDRLIDRLRQRCCLHADETPVSQLDPKSGKNKQAYLWVYRSNDLDGDPPIVVFDYQTNRSGKHVRNFLGQWGGHLMVDDYAGYKKCFAGDEKAAIELGCMAHARRKFFDLHAANQSPIAARALDWFGLLYQVERQAKDLTVENRAQLRNQISCEVLDQFHEWLTKIRATVAPGGALIKAIDYTLRRWPALIRYAKTGNLPIDNNPVENAVRPIAIGRKNWLHYGSERAGHRAAVIHSLMATAKLNGLDPAAWLADVLDKLPTWPNSRIDELLPLVGYKMGYAC